MAKKNIITLPEFINQCNKPYIHFINNDYIKFFNENIEKQDWGSFYKFLLESLKIGCSTFLKTENIENFWGKTTENQIACMYLLYDYLKAINVNTNVNLCDINSCAFNFGLDFTMFYPDCIEDIKKDILEYLNREFSDGNIQKFDLSEFNNLDSISLAYTSYEDLDEIRDMIDNKLPKSINSIEMQVEADLVHCSVNYFLNGFLCGQDKYNNLQELDDNLVLDFNELVFLEDDYINNLNKAVLRNELDAQLSLALKRVDSVKNNDFDKQKGLDL